MISAALAASWAMFAPVSPAQAQEVWITPDMPFADYSIGGQDYSIERDQNTDARLENDFARTSRACPPFCVQPMEVAPGVRTVGELELVEFLTTTAQDGQGYLVDARVRSWYEKGTIPGSVNLPFTVFADDPSNPFLYSVLTALGGVLRTSASWNFDGAQELLLFCNGPWCGQSPTAIRNLLAIGYPAEKLLYYRGGMQAWQSLGMTVVVPVQPAG